MQKDEKYAADLGIKKPRRFHWYLHAALVGINPNLSMCKDMQFPPPLPPGHWEPMGTECNKKTDWESADALFDNMSTSTAADTAAAAGPRVEDVEVRATSPAAAIVESPPVEEAVAADATAAHCCNCC